MRCPREPAQEEVAWYLPWVTWEVRRYVHDFDTGHVSGWRAMASLLTVYHRELLATSISMRTTTFMRASCIFNAVVERTSMP